MYFLLLYITTLLRFAFITSVSSDDPTEKPLSHRAHRIVDGRKSSIEEFPFMVALEYLDGPTFLCGGSILTPHYIITAAHCIEDDNPEELQVRAGSSIKQKGGTVHSICDFIIYPERMRTMDNSTFDLAIVELAKPIRLDRKTKKSIPMFELGEESENGTKATVAGWGCTDNNGTDPEDLQSLEMIILDKKDCQPSLEKKRKICASAPDVDNRTRGTCYGDSGGPLVIDGKLAGVVSYGNKLTLDSRLSPNVFTEISRYRKWIDKTIGETNEIEGSDDNSAITEFPYLVALEYGPFNWIFCGGSIISPWLVLTAGDCFFKGTIPINLNVRAGSSFLEEGGSRHKVRNVTIHPQYSTNEKVYNLAVLFLENPIEIDNRTKKPIPMFEPGKEISDGSIAKIAGWGCPIVDNVTLAQLLQGYNMTVIDKKDCQMTLEEFHNSHLEEGLICIAVSPTNILKRDICYGDTGNALVVDEKLAGVVSYFEQSQGSEPHTFVEIAHHRKWIDETVKALNAMNNHSAEKNDEEDAEIKKFPYLATLEYNNSMFICSGAIVSKNHILTAARCTRAEPSRCQVRVGSSLIEQRGIVKKVNRFIANFGRFSLALVELKEQIKLGINTAVNSIPMFGYGQEIKNGSMATMTGWGCIDNHRTDAKLLKSFDMTVVDKKVCEEAYEDDYVFHRERRICVSYADEKNRGECNDDSGNILVINGRLAGVKVYNHESYIGKPYKFLKIAYFRTLIEERIQAFYAVNGANQLTCSNRNE